MIFVCCPDCSDCQKAKKWLEDNKVSFVSRDITKEKLSCDELKMWQKKSGLPLKEFCNTCATSANKDMNSTDKKSTMTEDELCKQLTNDTNLLKCPIAVTGSCVLVGFDESKWKEKLL